MSPIGTKIGPYRIEREIARGGMGIVYLARDTRLDRPAALKALPDDLASDPDRLLRFEREAKLLASLNHSNVAGIYGVEVSEGRRYLALEFVEGETLAARIARGPLPISDAVEICLQIAAGVEAAHEGGIIHRDLKPGNVMITPGDQVKVVDFGLAKGKVAEREAGSPDSPTVADSPALAHSPTIGSPETLPGVILGTAAYLSPEQARGKAVDRRTDIWSFGCVLYECLTGRRAFEGESVSDVIARILQSEVEWARLPRSTPARLRELLQRCLEKDPRKRLRDMGDARLALEEIREGKVGSGEAVSAPAPGLRLLSPRVVAVVALAAILAAAAGLALWKGSGGGGSSAARGVKRFSVTLPPEIKFYNCFISPDGRFLIAHGTPRAKVGEPAASPRLYRRRVDGDQFEQVVGTEGRVWYFDVSPDGRWLYFVVPVSERSAEHRLMKILLEGSAAPVAVASWDPSWEYFCPLSGGDLLVSTLRGTAYVRIPASGGAPSTPIKFHAPGFTGSFDLWQALPSDRRVLVTLASYEGGGFQTGIGALDPATGKVTILLHDGGNPVYSPTGHLLFTRGSTLLAVAFDLKRIEIRGEPVALVGGLRTDAGTPHAFFGLSRDGTLSYMPGGLVGGHRRLIVVDAQGQVSDWSRDRAFYRWRVVSAPDGDRVAFSILNARGLEEIWISKRGSTTAQRTVAIPGVDCNVPAWSPDGSRIAYCRSANNASGVYIHPLEDGAPPRQISRADSSFAYSTLSWSPDGSTLLATMVRSLPGGVDIVRIPARPAADSLPPPAPLIAAPAVRERRPSFSPDGRWITFDSDETGREEVYVAPYHADGSVGTPMMVSSGGGFDPRWSRGGKVVFYQSPQGSPQRRVMSVALRFQPALSAAEPVPRWDLNQLRVIDDGGLYYDLLPGDRMVAIQKGEDEDEITRAEVVLNFFDELKQKLRAAGRR